MDQMNKKRGEMSMMTTVVILFFFALSASGLLYIYKDNLGKQKVVEEKYKVTQTKNESDNYGTGKIGTVSSSTIFSGWNRYTDENMGITVDYPPSWVPTLSAYNEIYFHPFNDLSSSLMSLKVAVFRNLNDGHQYSFEEYFRHPGKSVIVDGKEGSYNLNPETGITTYIPLDGNFIFATTLNPDVLRDKQILSTIKFIPRKKSVDFKLKANAEPETSSYNLAEGKGNMRIGFLIFGSLIESPNWNGKWTLHLYCPAGVTSFSYDSYLKCNETTNEWRWHNDTNPGGWLNNVTNETKDVRAVATLIGDTDGESLATDEVTITIPPAIPNKK